MHAYLACFDISDDRTRNRVGDLLGQYGTRVQRSVFEISLRTPAELQRLKEELRSLPFEDDDDIRFYMLCRNCRSASHTLEDGRVALYPSAVIV